ncbi:hypothetical protein [Gillisia sp. Hel_I_86]|uniref:hypothetical protein n=1 Tax=Gillisia sp. Hel_I_86 TaxID=1249981 RepID=UPI0021BDCE06|nr:hypothetical protein [Gillisia sp. Hel_I_86]
MVSRNIQSHKYIIITKYQYYAFIRWKLFGDALYMVDYLNFLLIWTFLIPFKIPFQKTKKTEFIGDH